VTPKLYHYSGGERPLQIVRVEKRRGKRGLDFIEGRENWVREGG